MGIEPTARYSRATGFEDQGSHQTPIASGIGRTVSDFEGLPTCCGLPSNHLHDRSTFFGNPNNRSVVKAFGMQQGENLIDTSWPDGD